MKTLLAILLVASVGFAMVPEAAAHTCQPGTFLTFPISFSYDSGHAFPPGHACVFVGNTAILA